MFEKDEDAAMVVENTLFSVTRAIRTIRCAQENGLKSSIIYFGKYLNEVKIGDLASSLNWYKPDNADEKISFFLTAEQKLLDNDYIQTTFDIENIVYDDITYKVKLKGNNFSLFISCNDNFSKNKEAAYNFIKSLFKTQIGTGLSKVEADNLSLESWEYEPPCAFNSIGLDRRLELLKQISEGRITDSKEKIVINLLKTTPANDALSLIEKLNSEVMINIYNGTDDYRREFYYALLTLTAKAYQQGKVRPKEVAVGKIGIENLNNLNVKTIKAEGIINGNHIEFKNIKKDYWDITGIALISLLTKEETNLFTARPMDIIVTKLNTSKPGSVFQGNGNEVTFIRQPAICVKYLLDEQSKQFNWERLEQLSKNTAYAGLFYVGAEYAPTMLENAYFKRFLTDLFAQAAAKAFKNGGDIQKTVESLDFSDAGVKSLFGSQLKVFQKILKTYGEMKIVNGEMDFQPKTIDQSSSIELFYRIIFSHMPSPVGESKQLHGMS